VQEQGTVSHVTEDDDMLFYGDVEEFEINKKSYETNETANYDEFEKEWRDVSPNGSQRENFSAKAVSGDTRNRPTQKRKRLFYNNKIVPCWAEDLELVRRVQTAQQQQTEQFEATKIFGALTSEPVNLQEIFGADRNDL
jgi:hypothetical protein